MNNEYEGLGVLGAVGLIFITLKLCGVVDLPWWLVTFPFWGLPAAYVGFLTIALVIVCVEDFITHLKRH